MAACKVQTQIAFKNILVEELRGCGCYGVFMPETHGCKGGCDALFHALPNRDKPIILSMALWHGEARLREWPEQWYKIIVYYLKEIDHP